MNLIPSLFPTLRSLRTRAIVSAIGSSAFYGIEYLSNPAVFRSPGISAIFANPVLLAPPIIAAGAIVIPKFLVKSSQRSNKPVAPADAKAPAEVKPEATPIQEAAPQVPASIPAPAPLIPADGQKAAANLEATAPAKLIEQIDKKLEPVTEELGAVRIEVGSFKNDLDGLKQSLREINSTFESSLVELKSFQAEMVNPINFMRKYFDSMDIKSLSDPVMPFRPAEASPTPALPAIPLEKVGARVESRPVAPAVMDHPMSEVSHSPEFRAHESGSHAADEPAARRTQEIKGQGSTADFIRSSLERGLTPGKIMSIVAVVDDVLSTMGPDGVGLILEQYKNLGLKPEDEKLIYGVLKMLNESKMLPEDIIAMLYRFGDALGLNDSEAELQYTRLVANRKSKKSGSARNKTKAAIT